MQYLCNPWSNFKSSWTCLKLLNPDTSLNLMVYNVSTAPYIIIQPHLLTRRSWLKTGLPPTAVTSLEKTNGHQTHQTLILLITMSGKLCLNATRHFNPSQISSTSWRKSCKQYGLISHRTPSTRPYELCKKTSSLCEMLGRTLWTRLEINFFAGFWTVNKVTVSNVKFLSFHSISIQALWWKL